MYDRIINGMADSNLESLESQKKLTREVYITRRKELEVANSLDTVLEEEL